MNGLILILIILTAWLSTYVFEKLILSLHDLLLDIHHIYSKVIKSGRRPFNIKKTIQQKII